VTTSGEPDPDISIVVPTRNRAVLLGRLLRQLTNLEPGPSYEIIVVDEGSSDDTPALLDRFAADHGVRVVRHDDPRGLPGARNAGTAAARGRYVAWIDDDDLTAPDRLRRQHEALTTTGRRWSCAARVDIDDDLAVIGHVACPPPPLLPGLLRSNVLPSAGQGLLVEAGLDAEVGGYDETLRSAEDWDYCLRLAAVAEAHLLDEPLVGYRTGAASMSTNTPRMEEAIATVIAKHRDLYRAHATEPDWQAIHESLLPADLLGSRRAAASRAWKALRSGPSARGALRALAVVAVPERVAARSRARRREQVPAAWEAAARRWLDRVPAEG